MGSDDYCTNRSKYDGEGELLPQLFSITGTYHADRKQSLMALDEHPIKL